MDTKERVSKAVQEIATKGEKIDDNLVSLVKSNYRDTLAGCIKTGESIKNATNDTLQGIETGLRTTGQESASLMEKTFDAIMGVAHDVVDQTMDTSRSYANDARLALDKALDDAHGEVGKVNTQTRENMTRAHAHLLQETEAEKARLQDIAESILDYSKNSGKAWGEAGLASYKSALATSQQQIDEINRKTSEQTEKLLRHSQANVSEWLQKMAEDIAPDTKK